MASKKRSLSHEKWDDGWSPVDDITDSTSHKRGAQKRHRKEQHDGGFSCVHCAGWIAINEAMGTHNRNHCPSCLWSRHMDDNKSGDRRSDCQSPMVPIALSFKERPGDKYATSERALGELMLVHECTAGDRIRLNRIAADDSPQALMQVFYDSHELPETTLQSLKELSITIAIVDMADMVLQQLYGLSRQRVKRGGGAE